MRKYQVDPLRFIDLKALMGDTADNIPGVPKVGEKTATELMVRFGSLDGIYEHIDEVTKKSVKESLVNNQDLARLSRTLATINVDSEIDYSFDNARVGNFYTEEAYVLCKQLEFKNLLSRFERDVTVLNTQTDYFAQITELSEVEALFAECMTQQAENGSAVEAKEIGIAVLADGSKIQDCVGVAIALHKEKIRFIPCQGLVTAQYLHDRLAQLGRSGACKFSMFDIKKQYSFIEEGLEADKKDVLALYRERRYFDVLLAAYLLNPLKNDYAVEDIANEYLELTIPDRNQVCGKATYAAACEQNAGAVMEFACYNAYVCLEAAPLLREKLCQQGMDALMYEVEMPLTKVLYEMERCGVLVKPDALKAYGEALTGRILELEQSVYKQAECEFNINSPKQLGEVLFEKMGIPGGKKTKTGYSTAADVLEIEAGHQAPQLRKQRGHVGSRGSLT